MEPADFHVDADIRKATTLPTRAFTDPDFLTKEIKHVFGNTWLLAAPRTADQLRADPRSLVELVRTRGSRVPLTMLDKPLFLQRSWKGQLKAFPNVCTHAWHALVQGPVRDRAIVCPQHGRRFDTEGRFVSQPGLADDMPGIPRPEDHLIGLLTHQWGDLVWVRHGGASDSTPHMLHPIKETLANLPWPTMARRPFPGEVRELAGNWKQHAWNYLDSLHIPHIHGRPGGLTEVVDLESYHTEIHQDSVLQWVYAKRQEDGFHPDRVHPRFADPKRRRVFALWWFIFPNVAINCYPWGVSVNMYEPIAQQPQRTLFHWYQWAWDEAAYARRNDSWQLITIDDEDVDAMAQVSQGIKADGAPRGVFLPTAEEAPHWFHRKVFQCLFPDAA